MWNCYESQNSLLAYIHDELSSQDRQRVAQHLQSCDDCYARYRYERDVTQHLTQNIGLLPTPTQPQLDMIWQDVQMVLEERPQCSQPLGWRGHWVGMALALLCVLPWAVQLGSGVVVTTIPVSLAPAEMPENTPNLTQTTSQHNQKVALNLPTENAKQVTPTATLLVTPLPENTP